MLSAELQAQFAIVGNPALTSNNAISAWANTNNSTSRYTRSLIIVTADEMRRGGFVAGTITSLSFLRHDTATYRGDDCRVRFNIGHIPYADSLFPAGSRPFLADSLRTQQVFSSNTVGFRVPGPAQWQEFVFQTPFQWNGRDNILIATTFFRPIALPRAIVWRNTATPTGRFKYAQTYSTANFPVNVSPSLARPTLRLGFQAVQGVEAGMLTINSPSNGTLPGSQALDVSVINAGNQPITSLGLASSINGQPGPTFTYNTTIPVGFNPVNINIGNGNIQAGNNNIKVWITTVNGQPSAFTGNDTTSKLVYSCLTNLNGTYTLDRTQPSSATNIQSFADLTNFINQCGLSGNVTVNVVAGSGPYLNERFALTNVPSLQNGNFRLTLNGNGETIRFRGNGSNPNSGVLQLVGTGHVTFNNFNVVLDSLSTGGFGIALIGNCPGVQITNNRVSTAYRTSTSNIYQGIFVSNATGGNPTPTANISGLVIDNNKVDGFTYGIGVNSDTLAFRSGFRITNNEVTNFSTNGIWLGRSDSSFVSGNTVTRPLAGASTSACNGINQAEVHRRLTIAGNKIFNLHGYATSATGAAYGITIGANARVTREASIYNNVIGGFNHAGASVVYGINATGRVGLNIYHNTISLDNVNANSTSTTYGIFLGTGASARVNVYNNIISVLRTSTGIKGCIYATTAQTGINIDNNVYLYDSLVTNAYVVYTGSVGYRSLTGWRTASRHDRASIFGDPAYASPASFDYEPASNVIDNVGRPTFVTTDFLGRTRSTTSPDPGAYEVSFVGVCVRPVNLRYVRYLGNTVTMKWTLLPPATGGTYEFQYGPLGFNLGSGSIIPVPSGDSVFVPNLVSGVRMHGYVRRICTDGTGQSAWAGPVEFVLPIPNDDPCGALQLPVGNVCNFIGASNVGATATVAATYGYTNPSCAFATAPKDVWFTFTTTATGPGSTDVIFGQSGFAIGQIRVFSSSSGTCNGPFTEELCAVRTGGSMPSTVINNLTPSTTYYLMVAGDFNNDPTDVFNVCLSSDIANSLADLNNIGKLTLVPNPTSGQVQISGNGIEAGAKVSILNSVGALVFADVAQSSVVNADLAGQPAGIYHVVVANNGKRLTSTLVVK